MSQVQSEQQPGNPEQYLPFVRKIAGRIARRLPSTVDVEDLVGAGTIGLMEALERYDPDGGRSFETYAEFRVKGAILDELRRNDPVNRAARTAQTRVSNKVAQLTAELGRPPTGDEVAKALDLKNEQVAMAGSLRVVSIDAAPVELEAREPGQEDVLAEREIYRIVEETISRLPKRQQMVLSLCYLEGISQVQVAELIGVTESRVSQILSQTRKRIRDAVKRATR